MKDAHDIILGPVVTEKLGRLAEGAAAAVQRRRNAVERRKAAKKPGGDATVEDARSVFAFRVHPDANKIDVRRAVEALFKVDVEQVCTMNRLGKIKRMGRFAGRRPAWKKAYVTLAPGQSIPELS